MRESPQLSCRSWDASVRKQERLAAFQLADKEHLAVLRDAAFDASAPVRIHAAKALFQSDGGAAEFLRNCWKKCKGKDQVIAAALLMVNVAKERELWTAALVA